MEAFHALYDFDADDARADELDRLRLQVDELSRERARLLATIDILQEITSSLHFTESAISTNMSGLSSTS